MLFVYMVVRVYVTAKARSPATSRSGRQVWPKPEVLTTDNCDSGFGWPIREVVGYPWPKPDVIKEYCLVSSTSVASGVLACTG